MVCHVPPTHMVLVTPPHHYLQLTSELLELSELKWTGSQGELEKIGSLTPDLSHGLIAQNKP